MCADVIAENEKIKDGKIAAAAASVKDNPYTAMIASDNYADLSVTAVFTDDNGTYP